MNAQLNEGRPTIGSGTNALPITVRINEACRLTGIGRSKLYELIQAGEIDTVKVGSITLVPTESLVTFLSSRRR